MQSRAYANDPRTRLTTRLVTKLCSNHNYNPTTLREYLQMCDTVSLVNWDSYKTPFPTAAYEMYCAQTGESQSGPKGTADGYLGDDDQEAQMQAVIELSKRTAKEEAKNWGQMNSQLGGPSSDKNLPGESISEKNLTVGIYKHHEDSVFLPLVLHI